MMINFKFKPILVKFCNNFLGPVVASFAVVRIALGNLFSCLYVPQGIGIQLAIIILLVVDNLAVGIIGMVSYPSSIPQYQQCFSILVVHSAMDAMPNKISRMRPDKLLNVTLSQRNVRLDFVIADLFALNRRISSPPDASLGDVLHREKAKTGQRALFYCCFE